MASQPQFSQPAIRLLLADVDGTLVTQTKVLTERARRAVHSLHEAGILFAITSGRPPRGMSMLVEPLAITTPIAAFNGGIVVKPDLTPVLERSIPDELVPRIIRLLEAHQLDVWLYRGADWFIRNRQGPHVDKEERTVQFPPTVIRSFGGLMKGVVKLVGVSDDYDGVARGEREARHEFGDHVSAARSQPYYLDVTHPEANKGGVVRYLSEQLKIAPEQIATVGDMPNDVLMFAVSGLSIAMGNASPDVQRAARRVTTTNEQEGFANAVEKFLVGKKA